MTDKPVVGVTARTLPVSARVSETVPRAYLEPLLSAGALPVVLPNADPDAAEAFLGLLDGLLLTGGDDPHPHLFGEEPHPKIELVDERRDRFEIALVRAARERDLPVFGICRGIQLMNLALGGDIHQDIASQTPSPVQHAQRRIDDGAWHRVDLHPGSLLARILGVETRSVNSFHHQACRRVGKGLEICATSPEDGLIEGLEDPSRAFFLGVQWHPELAAEDAPLFGAFLEAARRQAAKSSKNRRTPLTRR